MNRQASPWTSMLMCVAASPAGRALIALLLVLIIGAAFHADGTFFKAATHRDTLRQASVYGILACGMTLVIVSGGIDLSVGSVLALVAVFFSLTSIHWGWSPWLAVPVCLVVGALCGGTSGLLTANFRIQPFIATLAMMVFARGLAKTVSGGMKVSTAVQNADGSYRYVEVPAVFRGIDSRFFGEYVSMVTLIFLVCVAITWVALCDTAGGDNFMQSAATKKRLGCPAFRSARRKSWPTPPRVFWPPWPESARRPRNSKATRKPALPTSFPPSPS